MFNKTVLTGLAFLIFFSLHAQAGDSPAEVSYFTYKGGKLVGVENRKAPKFKETTNTDKVLYVKSLGILVEKAQDKDPAPLQALKSICDQKTPAACLVLGAYFDEVNQLP